MLHAYQTSIGFQLEQDFISHFHRDDPSQKYPQPSLRLLATSGVATDGEEKLYLAPYVHVT